MKTDTSRTIALLIFSSLRALKPEVVSEGGNNSAENGKLMSFDHAIFLREVDRIRIFSSRNIIKAKRPGIMSSLLYFVITFHHNRKISSEIIGYAVLVTLRIIYTLRTSQFKDGNR